MLKIWALTFICIGIFTNVSVCDETRFFEDVAVDLIENLPTHLKDAIHEVENEDSAITNQNITEKIRFPRLPKLSQCFKDYVYVYRALFSNKTRGWALQVFDSWGKFPSGLGRGNTYELGDFDECLKINEPNKFEPRYCVLRIGQHDLILPPKSDPTIDLARSMQNVMADVIDGESNSLQPRMVPTATNMVALNLGICLPKSCTQEGIDRVLAKVQNKMRKLNKNLKEFSLATIPYTCQTADDLNWNFSAWDHVTLGLILFLVVAATLSTIYDVVQTKRDEDKKQIFMAFSLKTNGQKLFSTKKSRAYAMLECLNGMRVLSAFWVIYAHSNIVSLGGPVFNIKYLLEWLTEITSIPMLMAWFSVDTFLFISGFLAVGSVLRTLQKTGSINIPKLYIHRYLRLTAILSFVVLMSVTVYRKLAVGPLWWLFIEHGINCEHYWWSSLLYIQNYYNPEAICLAHTWYLSVDMQLYLFAPILAYLMYRLGRPFMLVIVLLMCVSIGWTYYLYAHFDLMFQLTNIKNDVQDVFIKTYYPTHIRLVPWLFGGAYAYYMNKSKGRPEKWSIVRLGIHWLSSGILVAFLVWYTYNMQQVDHKGSAVESGLYTGFSRLIWSIIIMLVIHACITGHGGPVNSFLSLPMWRPLSRLTYAIYLVHMPVMMLTTGALKRPIYFSFRSNLFKYFGDLVVAVLLSMLLTLGIESPVTILENMLFGLCKPRSNTELPTNVTVRPLDESTQRSRPTAPVP